MKSLFRNTLINALSLYFLTQIFEGVRVTGGISSFLFGGLVLSVMFKVLKPVLNIVSLPLNIITLGAFSFLINIFIFYLATRVIGTISIREFTYHGVSIAGFVIPKITFNTFFAYAAAAMVQSIFVTIISWLRK